MAGYLLDTHVLIWWLADESYLSMEAKHILGDATSALYISAASLWEMRIKEIKKIWQGPSDILGQLQRWQIDVLPIDASAALDAPKLILPQADPFDRMILCHAMQHTLILLTADTNLLEQTRYNVHMIKAKK